MFTAWLPNERGPYVHVIGDVRKALKRSVKRAALRRWCAMDLQGRTPAAHPDGTSRLCVLVRRLRSSTLLRFAVLALCEWLPSGRYHGRIRREDKNESGRWSCPSCPAVRHETSRHAILCPSRRGILSSASLRARILAEVAAEGRIGTLTLSPAETARQAFRSLSLGAPRVASAVAWTLSANLLQLATTPRQAAQVLGRTPHCLCHSGCCRLHGWRPSPVLISVLCARLSLDTALFLAPGEAGPSFLEWHLGDEAARAAGSPWDEDWSGMFALCVPRGAVEVMPIPRTRVLERAHLAIMGARPTRTVLVTHRSLLDPNARLGFICGDAAVNVVQNDAAEALSPLDNSAPWARGLRWHGAGRPTLISPIIGFWHPRPISCNQPWLAEADKQTFLARESLEGHDRYAGTLGVPPKGFDRLVACSMSGKGRPDPCSLAAATGTGDAWMIELFREADRAWLHSCAGRRLWWRAMQNDVVDAEVDVAALQQHQRKRAAEDKAYARQVASRAAKRQRVAHVAAIARHRDMTTKQLLQLHPELRSSIPPDIAATVPAPPTTSWHGTLRPRPAHRRSLNDNYVGDAAKRRSLWKDRQRMIRRFGRSRPPLTHLP